MISTEIKACLFVLQKYSSQWCFKYMYMFVVSIFLNMVARSRQNVARPQYGQRGFTRFPPQLIKFQMMENPEGKYEIT